MALSGYQRCRERAGLTLGQAAEKLGISVFLLETYERWLEDVPYGVLFAMCRAYGCSADDLVISPGSPWGPNSNRAESF